MRLVVGRQVVRQFLNLKVKNLVRSEACGGTIHKHTTTWQAQLAVWEEWLILACDKQSYILYLMMSSRWGYILIIFRVSPISSHAHPLFSRGLILSNIFKLFCLWSLREAESQWNCYFLPFFILRSDRLSFQFPLSRHWYFTVLFYIENPLWIISNCICWSQILLKWTFFQEKECDDALPHGERRKKKQKLLF